MFRSNTLILAVLLTGCSTPQAHGQTVADLAVGSGEKPEQTAGIAMIESTVRADLKDPESARFAWPNGFVLGEFKPMLGRSSQGWITCGTVNSKNGYGGYSGQYAVIGVIRDGAIVTADMDSPGRFSASAQWVADQCRKLGVPVF